MDVKVQVTVDHYSPRTRTISVPDDSLPDTHQQARESTARTRAIKRIADELEGFIGTRNPVPRGRLLIEFPGADAN